MLTVGYSISAQDLGFYSDINRDFLRTFCVRCERDCVVDTNKQLKSYTAGSYLFRAGDPGGDLIFVQEGQVTILKEDSNGEVEIARVGPGEVLGIMTVLEGGLRTASARAETNVKVTVVRHTQFVGLLESVPTWVRTIIKDLILRVNNANTKYVDLLATKDSAVANLSKVDVACQIALGIQSRLLDAKAETAKGGLAVGEVTAYVQNILRYRQGIVSSTVEAFQKVGILSSAQLKTDHIDNLGTFVEVVDIAQKNKKRNEFGLVNLSTEECRKILAYNAMAAKMELPSDQVVIFKVTELEEKMEGAAGYSFDPIIAEMAQKVGLMTVEPADSGTTVKFVPKEVAIKLRCIELYHQLNRKERRLNTTR